MMSDAAARVLLPRRHDKTLDCFSGHKRAAAVNVCALVIPLFCGISKIATRAGVGGMMAFRTMKHDEGLRRIQCVNFTNFYL